MDPFYFRGCRDIGRKEKKKGRRIVRQAAVVSWLINPPLLGRYIRKKVDARVRRVSWVACVFDVDAPF